MRTRFVPHLFSILLLIMTLALVGVLVLAQLGRAAETQAGRRRGVPPTLTLRDPGGKPRRLADLAGTKATVLVFLGTECPISNAYAPEIAALAKRYAARGARFVGIYPNAGVTGPVAAKHGAAYRLNHLALLLDPEQALADRVGAAKTPEAAILDRDGTVLYVGRIDDRYVDRGRKRARTTERSLANALEAVLAGRPVKASPPAVGCAIERAEKTAAAGPTYARDVAPVLQANCQSCHRQGEIGPFPLESYADAKRWARNIAEVAGTRRMPPWKPVAGHGDFAGPRRLTDAQIETLAAWADAGAPLGDPKQMPAPPVFPKGWRLGTPDLVLTMPEPWTMPATGSDVYRCFVLPTGLTEDKDIVGMEIRAGNKSVVHHVLVYADDQGRARAKDAAAPGPGYTSFSGPGFVAPMIGAWAPGNLPRFLPEGVGQALPKGSDLILQVHYHPTGKPEADTSSIGLYFAKKPVAKQLRTFPVVPPPPSLRIPAGEANFQITASQPVPFDAQVLSVTPHMHLLGRAMTLTAILPDGAEKPLIRIDDWDFQWQDTYVYKEPVRLPKGSQIRLEAAYDNSEKNPRNPNTPPQLVTWGEATTDEMCIGFINYIVEDERDLTVRILDGRFDLLSGGGRRR